MTARDWPRLIISAFVLLLFGALVWKHSESALLVGALIAMATQATGYWLGSSKGSSEKTDQLERLTNADQVTVKGESVSVEGRR